MEPPEGPPGHSRLKVPRLDDPESPSLLSRASSADVDGRPPQPSPPPPKDPPRRAASMPKKKKRQPAPGTPAEVRAAAVRRLSSPRAWLAGQAHRKAPARKPAADSMAVQCEEVEQLGRVRAMESHTMVATPQGDLLVFGGCDGDEIFNGVWVLNPETTAWHRQKTGGPRPPCVAGHCAVVIGHRMFIYGGHGHESSQELGDRSPSGKHLDRAFAGAASATRQSIVYILDLKTWAWEQLATAAPASLRDHCAVAVGRQMWVFGGYLPDKSRTNLIRVFDCELMQWRPWEEYNQQAQSKNPAVAAKVPGPRSGASAVLHDAPGPDEGLEVVVFGGRAAKAQFCSDTFKYQVAYKLWERIEAKGELPEPRAGHTAAVHGGVMLVFGGYGLSGDSQRLYGDLFGLDLTSHVWRPVAVTGPAHPLPRCNHASLMVEKGKGRHFLVSFGGWVQAGGPVLVGPGAPPDTADDEHRLAAVLPAGKAISRDLLAMLLMGAEPGGGDADPVPVIRTEAPALGEAVPDGDSPTPGPGSPPPSGPAVPPAARPSPRPAPKDVTPARPPAGPPPKAPSRPHPTRGDAPALPRPPASQPQVLMGEAAATILMAHPPRPLKPITAEPWVAPGQCKPRAAPEPPPRPPGSARKVSPAEADALAQRLSAPLSEGRRRLLERLLGRGLPSKEPLPAAEIEKVVQRLHFGLGPGGHTAPRSHSEPPKVPTGPPIDGEARLKQVVTRLYYNALELQKVKARELVALHLPEAPRQVATAQQLQQLTKRLTHVPAPPKAPTDEPPPARPARRARSKRRTRGASPASPAEGAAAAPAAGDGVAEAAAAPVASGHAPPAG